jgi:hypothetical protein
MLGLGTAVFDPYRPRVAYMRGPGPPQSQDSNWRWERNLDLYFKQ